MVSDSRPVRSGIQYDDMLDETIDAQELERAIGRQIVYDYLLISPGSYLITETGGRIIIGSHTVADTIDQRSTYEMTEAFLQIQSVDPITLVPIGSFRLNSTITVTNPTFVERILTVAATDTVVPVPQGATVCIITPPAGCTSTLILKGATGDTGQQLATNNPSCFVIPAGPGQLLLNSSPFAVYMFTFV